MIVVSSADDLLRSCHDGIGDGGIDDAKLLVDQRSSALDVGKGNNLSGFEAAT